MPETITLKAPADVEFDLEIPRPDISHLVTESEEPVDNIISEKQMRLLTRPLYSSWQGRRYVRRPDSQLPDVGLAMTLWQGEFETWTRTWLRWCDPAGNILPTGAERAEMEKERADIAEEHNALAEERAVTAEEKAARFAAKLRELGLDPEQV